MTIERVLDILREFDRHDVEYVLVGGIAVGLQGLVRGTEDVDFFIRPTPENVRRIRVALTALWKDSAIEEIIVDDLAGEYSTVRYGPPGEDFVIDLIARLGEAFDFDSLTAETMTIEGIRVRVATPGTLYRMKKDTLRPIDQIDAEALRQKFGLEE